LGFFSPVVGRYRRDGLALTLLRQTSRTELPHHGHANPYFTFLVSGSYRERVGRKEIDHAASAVVFHPPAMEHVDAYGSGGGLILAVEMEPAWLDAWELRSHAAADFAEIRCDDALRGAWALYRALGGRDPALAVTIETHVGQLVAALLRARPTAERQAPPWLSRAAERLCADHVTPPSMTELAAETGVHPAHLSRTFRRCLGCSPTAFVQRERVRHVWRSLTRDGSRSLADVALEAGFSDQSHCTRVFRRVVGSSPGAWRREIGGHESVRDALARKLSRQASDAKM
jgi:AraC family transcriptional regulator